MDKPNDLPLANEGSCGCGGCTCNPAKPFEETYEILTEL